MWKAVLIVLPLAGCITTEDTLYLNRYPTRAEVDALNATAACKAMARNLVQVARCSP